MSEQQLDNIDCSNIRVFSLDGMTFDAKVVDVYDGDTATLVFKFYDYYKWKCRLDGIDTPELKTGNNKEDAVKARNYLRSIILNKIVKISCGTFDKYGRLLVRIVHDDIDINNLMITHGYAKSYSGGTKEQW